ncbi:hypothetical protein NQZ68_027317 [Dissostichus eleginoides]|nr:hypothetical protein NQZ68_027317 [Dissostichus eleginoides]
MKDVEDDASTAFPPARECSLSSPLPVTYGLGLNKGLILNRRHSSRGLTLCFLYRMPLGGR